MDDNVQKMAALLKESRVTAFLGGAGVSTESGVPDFRSPGIAAAARRRFGHAPEVLLSHDFFMAEPETFYAYYRSILRPDALPNPAHLALARLGETGKLNAVVTQNIDGLHRKAGSRRVYALHGDADWNRCMDCGKPFDLAFILQGDGVPRCTACGGVVKPEVVLYGEPLEEYVWRGAMAAVMSADTLVVGGTSLSVYPAAGLLERFMGRLILINRTETPADAQATLVIHAPIGETFTKVMAAMGR